jgi:hypothetical protein
VIFLDFISFKSSKAVGGSEIGVDVDHYSFVVYAACFFLYISLCISDP